jgi:hypothetical protein
MDGRTIRCGRIRGKRRPPCLRWVRADMQTITDLRKRCHVGFAPYSTGRSRQMRSAILPSGFTSSRIAPVSERVEVS